MRRPTGRLAQARIIARMRRMRRRLDAVDRMEPADRAAWRDERLRELRRHATAHSRWYREHHRGLEDAPFEALPVLTKADVVDRFDEVVTDDRIRLTMLRAAVADGRTPPGVRIAASSGSSGRPGLVPFTTDEWVGLLVNAARARTLAGPPAVPSGRPRTARIGSPSPWHLSRQLPTTLQDPRRPSLDLSAATDTAALADQLSAWRPDVLSGYPSVLAALASAQLDGRLDIAPVQVFTAGEPLTPGARALVKSAWGGRPFDQYATAEVSFVALEGRAHDGLHVMDTHVVVEIVDADGDPVAPGSEGRVVVTALGSRTLPLIRYDLGDVASLVEEPGPDARPRIRSLVGTARSLVSLPGPDAHPVIVHPVAFTSVLDAAPVRAWQVRVGADRVRVLVVGPDESFTSDDVESSLRRSLERSGAAPVGVEVVVVDELPRASTGKAGLVVSDDRCG